MPIVAITGAGGSGRSSAAEALQYLGYELTSFANRLRHLIAMSTGLPEDDMLKRPDEPFNREITLQAFHIDGMCRLAGTWVPLPDETPRRMREKAGRTPLRTPREVMQYVRTDLFEECCSPTFWVDLYKHHFQPDREANLVVDDTVSDEERRFVRSMGGLVLGIERPGHECDLADCDQVIVNDGTIEQLQDRVVAQVFGRLRGVPMSGLTPVAAAPVLTAVESAAPGTDTEALRAQVEDLQSRLRREVEARDETINGLAAEREALSVTLREARQQLAALSQPEPRVAPATVAAPLTAPVVPSPRDETDAAALAARLALALGLEAGIGKDPVGQPMLCIDLPAGRVSWPVTDGSYAQLPRYDKAPATLGAEARRLILLDPKVKVTVSTDQALEREQSELAVVSGVLKDLILLAEGCKIHRAYRAKQAPKGECPTCWSMWDASERLQGLSANYRKTTAAGDTD